MLVPTSFELARAEYSIMANKVYFTADEYAMYRAGYVYGYYIISFGCTSAGTGSLWRHNREIEKGH